MPTAQTRNNGWRGLISPWAVLALIGLVATLYWAYAPNFAFLFWRWWNDPNYSHGFFVIPIALMVLWQRRERFDWDRLRPTWVGLVALAGVLALRAMLYEQNQQWLESATIPLAVAAMVLTFGGWRLLWWAAPALVFLYFIMPMPAAFNEFMASQLQYVATVASCSVMQALGLPVLAEGQVLHVGSQPMEVAAACNGLSMLLTFLTLIAAVILLADLNPWEKLLLALSAVPIALISNILRIVVTGWAFYQFGSETVVFPGWTIERLTHDPAGWAMMPIALGLVWLELRLLAWLMVEEEVQTGNPMMILSPGPTPATVGIKKN